MNNILKKIKKTLSKSILSSVVAISLIGVLASPAATKAFDMSAFWAMFSLTGAEEAMADDRPARLDAYFAKRDMPLEGYGSKFVEVADKYGLDWRLLPAIAVRESSGGKHLMNNNPFGWGSCKIKFTSFNDSIEEVGSNLSGSDEDTARYYKDKTVYQILWAYNGTVMHSYPDEVMDIMKMF